MSMHISIKTRQSVMGTSEETITEEMIATDNENDATEGVVESISQEVIMKEIDPDQLFHFSNSTTCITFTIHFMNIHVLVIFTTITITLP